jgi:hypothetical protein
MPVYVLNGDEEVLREFHQASEEFSQIFARLRLMVKDSEGQEMLAQIRTADKNLRAAASRPRRKSSPSCDGTTPRCRRGMRREPEP